jgi:diguanylate cyclase (GGDEF)-like protein
LQNELEIQARTDTLTSILNELALKETASAEIERAKMNTTPLSFILIDIQNFSGHNDKFGQKSGDKLLIWISQQILQLIRTSDLLGRWKDDKFIVILPSTNLEDCITVTNRIQNYLHHNPFAARDLQIQVSTTQCTLTVSGSNFPVNIVDMIFDQLTKSLDEAKVKNSLTSATITY